MSLSRRDHLLETAITLFNRDGYHGTGIDKILAEAGVAKMTLYKHFSSKNDLILAALRRRDAQWRDWFVAKVETRATSPRARLLAAFDVLEDWFAKDDFHGCMFNNASAEYSSHDDPIHIVATEHHHQMFGYLRGLTDAMAVERPERLAREIMLLMEGAVIITQVNGPVGAARQAQRAAEVLITQAESDLRHVA